MINKNREPADMPQQSRLAYAKILSLLFLAERQHESTKMMELYRAMNTLKLKDRDRQAVIEFILSPDASADALCQVIMETSDAQEKNLLRFSILEDMYRMMMADHYISEEEAELFNRMTTLLQIEADHIDLVKNLYEQEDLYVPDSEAPTLSSHLTKQVIAVTSGVAVPLVMIAASGEKGLTPQGVLLGLRALSPGSGRKKSVIPGLILTIAAGAFIWQTAHWLVHLPEWRRKWIIGRLQKMRTKQFVQIEKDIEKDLRMINQTITKRSKEFQDSASWQQLSDLMKKTWGHVNTMTDKPRRKKL